MMRHRQPRPSGARLEKPRRPIAGVHGSSRWRLDIAGAALAPLFWPVTSYPSPAVMLNYLKCPSRAFTHATRVLGFGIARAEPLMLTRTNFADLRHHACYPHGRCDLSKNSACTHSNSELETEPRFRNPPLSPHANTKVAFLMPYPSSFGFHSSESRGHLFRAQ